MTEIAAPPLPSLLDDALAEFAAAEFVATSAFALPDAGQRLAEIERLRGEHEAWRQSIEQQLEQVRPALEAIDEITAAEIREQTIANAKSQHGLTHIPDQLIGAALDDPAAMQTLATMNSQMAEAARAFEQRNEIEAAMAAVRGTSFARAAAPEYSPRQLMAMNDRDWANYKARLLAEAGNR